MRTTLLLLFAIAAFARAQYVPEPISVETYDFLDRLAAKGVVEFDAPIRPVSRLRVAEALEAADEQRDRLTAYERAALDRHLREYGLERGEIRGENDKYMTIAKYDPHGRWRLFAYRDEFFSVNLDPIVSFRHQKQGDESWRRSRSGARFYGYIGENVGYSFSYRDISEGGDVRRERPLEPETDFAATGGADDAFSYSEVHTTVGYSDEHIAVAAGKEFLTWGYGQYGKVVLSNNPPSFPFVRIDLELTDWLSFNYFHAWLISDVADSSEIYVSSWDNRYRTVDREKFLASHTLTIRPHEKIAVSLGESIVSSDRLRVAYLFPLMFFRLADHYYSQHDNNRGDNSQFFGAVHARDLVPNTRLYFETYIDEMTLSGLFDVETARYQAGFTVGGTAYDLPIENLDVTLEFTKIYPFSYKHYIPTQTYENASATMGHWLQSNSDMIYGKLGYSFTPTLRAEAYGYYARKGEEGTLDRQYKLGAPNPPFLFGLRTYRSEFGGSATWRPLYDVAITLGGDIRDTEEELADGATATTDRIDAYAILRYGF